MGYQVGDAEFDVTMGIYKRAEVYEIVDSFWLGKIFGERFSKKDIGVDRGGGQQNYITGKDLTVMSFDIKLYKVI